ncbi:MAG: HAD family hydrolase [Methylocystaceae bacterium]
MQCQAVLFDLDGTLLDIDMDLFLQHYFRVMVAMAKDKNMEADQLPQLVNEAVQAMVLNRDPNKFNTQIFDEHFYPRFPVEEKIMREFFLDFYEQGFPTLHPYCARYPQIGEIMQTVFDRGMTVVIATNSLFPPTAINQRLHWAGVGDYPYALVTTYENMHFTKPHLEYYEEICRYIGVEPAECLMVGNDVGEDMVASRLGMKTFLLTERLIPAKKEIIIPDHQGTISDLYALVKGL